MKTPTGKYAIIRSVPDTFDRCIKPDNHLEVSVDLAKEQHAAYCAALEGLGLGLIKIEADNRFPDCCFVEDAAIIVDDKAIVLPMGAPSRIGEEREVRKRLADFKEIFEIEPPANMDGGDVLKIGRKLFVGLSQRTNLHAVRELDALVSNWGFQVLPIQLREVLHLKSACSYLGDECILIYPGYLPEDAFSDYQNIFVHEEEAYSANCLAVNGRVLVSKGFHRTIERMQSAGFETLELDMTEFQKGGGSLTCLSIIF
ncbi:MAG: amidinotransferase [Candidatus Latescibacteria bacterium]|nr:amidinotransferase [Candidatus Latescibacterota bacterium]NIO29085.1 amidinotransferase [Candidatus Latescibacterota bacterium]NIO56710.1 amidinotransferase [Candidatus Latescibacterota bacterium]NIT02293.1 amidinotransferase [Candidatus Latescibacterota bacterium]NIT39178.1 amidinotransferase [Candidatus Latescibacterota bacterium]